jgi:hypothetical protein
MLPTILGAAKFLILWCAQMPDFPSGLHAQRQFRAGCDTVTLTRRRRRFGRYGWIDAMAKGHKTGGRQKGTRNKATVRLDAKLAEATERAIASLAESAVVDHLDMARLSLLLVAGFQPAPA